MEKNGLIVTDLKTWLDGFSLALENWEDWLNRVEQAYFTGEFTNLTRLEEESPSIQLGLKNARESRARLILLAKTSGFAGSSVTTLVRWLGPQVPSECNSRLLQLAHQLRRTQQLSTALWITGFQAASYTTALLDLLATGSTERATYGPCERAALEGGRIVDAAA